ncbi:MAG: ABC transporter permease [Gaiellaceae bacterium]
MLHGVLLKSLRDVRRSFAWWSLGLAGYVALIVGVWPAIRDNEALVELEESYPEELKAFFSFGGFDFSTAAGYLGAELFSLMVPLLLIIAAVGAGARAIAREEERGTLDLLLGNPISRRRLVLEKAGALALELAGLAVVLFAALALATTVADMDVSLADLASATTSAFLLGLAFGVIAFALGAATGRSAIAIGVSAALAVAAYLINGLSPLVDGIHSIRWLSPWYHYVAGDPLREGLSPGNALVLVAIAGVAAAVAVLAFDRRDVGVST